MEFGKPVMRIREPRLPRPPESAVADNAAVRRIVRVQGRWHLWIQACAWQVFTGNQCIGHSNLEGTSKQPIERAARELDGQKLLHVTVDPDEGKTVFEFDLGSRLETRPYDPAGDQWLLYEPSGFVFVLRGDGFYSHQAGDTPPDETIWQPLFPKQGTL